MSVLRTGHRSNFVAFRQMQLSCSLLKFVRGVSTTLIAVRFNVAIAVDLLAEVVLAGEVRLSPPPPLVKENFDPDGEASFCVGDIIASPPPPFAKENLVLDGDGDEAEGTVDREVLVDSIVGFDIVEGVGTVVAFVSLAPPFDKKYSDSQLGDI